MKNQLSTHGKYFHGVGHRGFVNNVNRGMNRLLKLLPILALAFVLIGVCDSVVAHSGVTIASFLPFGLPKAITKEKTVLAYTHALFNNGGGTEKTDEEKLMDKFKALVSESAKEHADKIKALETSVTAYKALETKVEAFMEKHKDTPNLKDTEEFKTLAKELSDAVLKIKEIESNQAIDKKNMTFEALALKALKENKEAIIKSMKEGKPFDLTIKYPETITEDNTIYAGETFQSLTQNTGIVSSIRRRITRYLENVSTGNISTGNALWFEEADSDGKPYFIHEKEVKAKAGFKIVEKTERVKKVAVRGKMTMEWMEDLPQFVAFLKNKLQKQMDIEIEDQLFNGAGGTGSDEPLGITINAVAFTGGSLAGNVQMPNPADVIRALVLQVEEALGMANAVFVHPGILAQLDTMKTSDGLYVRPSWANGELVAGIKVISTMALGSDEFVGGDLTVMNVLFRNGMTVRIGETGDDFQENKKSILLEQRLVQFISANDYAQIVKGDFTTAKAALEAGS